MRKLTLLTLLLVAASGCADARKAYLSTSGRLVRNPAENMLPTMKPGDFAVIDPEYYATNPVRRFDIVVVKSPEDYEPPGTKYIKRVVALGGETVEVRGGQLYVNGQVMGGPFVIVPHKQSEEFGPLAVPPGEFFLLGDNRPNSFDSRYWRARSTVDKSYLHARVTEIIPQ